MFAFSKKSICLLFLDSTIGSHLFYQLLAIMPMHYDERNFFTGGHLLSIMLLMPVSFLYSIKVMFIFLYLATIQLNFQDIRMVLPNRKEVMQSSILTAVHYHSHQTTSNRSCVLRGLKYYDGNIHIQVV